MTSSIIVLLLAVAALGTHFLLMTETKMFLPHPCVKVSIVGSIRDREVACSASDRQGSNFESCVWKTVSSQSSHHPQEILLARFSLYVHKGGLKPESFHYLSMKVGNRDVINYCAITGRSSFRNTFSADDWRKHQTLLSALFSSF